MATDYLLQEDGASKIVLEDGSGFLILESSTAATFAAWLLYYMPVEVQGVFKNVASQKATLFAFDATTGLPKTGDSANISGYVSKDDGAVTALGTPGPAEDDATNAKGMYTFTLTQAETNGDKLKFTAKSSTANVVLVPAVIYTTPANFTTFSIDSGGNAKADVAKLLGTAWLTPAVAGTPDVNAKQIGGTPQTGRDIGASVLLSVGTGAGQVNLSSGKVPATLAATDVTGNVAADLQTIKTQTVTCAGGVTVGAFVGNATAALAVDASGRVDLGKILGTASAGAVGYVGVDWGQVTNKTTANALTGTTISTTQVVASVSGAVASVTDAVTVAGSSPMTEGYAALHGAGTLEQILYTIQQKLLEPSVSGTVETVKKVDGVSVAFTETLNDAANPTSVTRAT